MVIQEYKTLRNEVKKVIQELERLFDVSEMRTVLLEENELMNG